MNDVPPQPQSVRNADSAQVSRHASSAAKSPQEAVSLATLQSRFDRIVADNEAQGITSSVSLTAGDRQSVLYRRGNTTPQFAASLNKLPIAMLLLEDLRSGKTSLDTSITWQASDIRGGFGAYDQSGAATQATVQELLQDMLQASGTTAVRVLVNYQLGGPVAVNTRLAAYPELATTRLDIVDAAANSFYLGNTTSDEALWSVRQVTETDDQYTTLVRQYLTDNIFSYFGVRSQLEGNDFIVLANKVGILDDPTGNNRHDVGVIYNTRTGQTYGYSFLTTAKGGDVNGTARAEHSLDLFGRQTLRYAGDNTPTKPKADKQQNRDGSRIETRTRY